MLHLLLLTVPPPLLTKLIKKVEYITQRIDYREGVASKSNNVTTDIFFFGSSKDSGFLNAFYISNFYICFPHLAHSHS